MDANDEMLASALRTQTIDNLVRDKENLEAELRRVISKLRKLAPRRTDLSLPVLTLPKYLRLKSDGDQATLKKLRVAVDAGLFDNAVLGSKVREFSYAWRSLLDDLGAAEGDPRRESAEATLARLGVNYTKTGTNGRKFFTF